MPFSSRNFTREPSLKRGGGCVSCPSAATDTSSNGSPGARAGRRTLSLPFPSPASPSVSVFFPLLRLGLGLFLVDPEPARILEDRAGGAQARRLALLHGLDVDGRDLRNGRAHLGGHEPIPD